MILTITMNFTVVWCASVYFWIEIWLCWNISWFSMFSYYLLFILYLHCQKSYCYHHIYLYIFIFLITGAILFIVFLFIFILFFVTGIVVWINLFSPTSWLLSEFYSYASSSISWLTWVFTDFLILLTQLMF